MLPDCSKGVYRPFRLTPREKRNLVRELTEKGVSGIDDFLKEDRSGGSVSDRMDEIRARISEQLEKVKARRRESLNRDIKRLAERAEMYMGQSDDGLLGDESSFRRFSSEQIRGEILASDIIRSLEMVETPRELEEKVGFLRRIWNFIKRTWRRFLAFLGRLFRRIRSFFKSGRRSRRIKEKRTRDKGAVVLPFPSLDKDLRRWEDEIDRRLDSDRNLQRSINLSLTDRYGYSESRIAFRRESDPDWYREEAKRILREDVSSRSERKSKDLRKRRKEGMDDLGKRKEKKRSLDDEVLKLQKQFDQEAERLDRRKEKLTIGEMKSELIKSLSRMGYLKKTPGAKGDDLDGWEITQALVEKFSELIYSELHEDRAGRKDLRGNQISDSGVYEKGRLRTIFEEPRMDMLTTLINARTNHPGDRTIDSSDMVVYREVRTSDVHGILLMDISGSMEENHRLEAAKRAVLALTSALKRENPKNKVDIVSVSTRAKPVTLQEVMEVQPRGFTNLAEAFAVAKSLFHSSRSDRHLLFLITDGLPEAYTPPGGKPVAGDMEKAMEMTLSEVKGLNRFSDLSFNIFLLEPGDEKYVNAARKIAREGFGKVIVADPGELARKMLGSYRSEGRQLSGV